MKNTNLQTSQILNKKFKTELSGYSSEAVDKFLDLVLNDYTKFENIITTLETELNVANQKLAEKRMFQKAQKLEIANLKSQLEAATKGVNKTILDEIIDIKRILAKM